MGASQGHAFVLFPTFFITARSRPTHGENVSIAVETFSLRCKALLYENLGNSDKLYVPYGPPYKDVTGYGFFMAATYGTSCPAHEYDTTPKVECRIHAPGIEFHTLPP